MNYDVVCESCEAAVISAPHIGDPEANELVKHLLDHHRDRVDPSRRPVFAEVVREFRLQKGNAQLGRATPSLDGQRPALIGRADP